MRYVQYKSRVAGRSLLVNNVFVSYAGGPAVFLRFAEDWRRQEQSADRTLRLLPTTSPIPLVAPAADRLVVCIRGPRQPQNSQPTCGGHHRIEPAGEIPTAAYRRYLTTP